MKKIALIGFGKMGNALVRGWHKRESIDRIIIFDPAAVHGDHRYIRTELFNEIEGFQTASRDADVFIMAVKPQDMATACEAITFCVHPETLIVSIAAGLPVTWFQRRFAEDQPVVRIMPNTPVAVGKGVSVAVASETVSDDQKRKIAELFESAGTFEWLESEAQMDPVTAISGSGPAYVFLLMETLAAAGVKAGLPRDMAERLARQTVIGSAALAEMQSDVSAERLRTNVTSPGGTTEAALKILMNGEVQEIFDNAIAAAVARSQELSR